MRLVSSLPNLSDRLLIVLANSLFDLEREPLTLFLLHLHLVLADLAVPLLIGLPLNALLFHPLLLLLHYLVPALSIDLILQPLCLILPFLLINAPALFCHLSVLLLLKLQLLESCLFLPLQKAHPILQNLDVLLSLLANLTLLEHFDALFN